MEISCMWKTVKTNSGDLAAGENPSHVPCSSHPDGWGWDLWMSVPPGYCILGLSPWLLNKRNFWTRVFFSIWDSRWLRCGKLPQHGAKRGIHLIWSDSRIVTVCRWGYLNYKRNIPRWAIHWTFFLDMNSKVIGFHSCPTWIDRWHLLFPVCDELPYGDCSCCRKYVKKGRCQNGTVLDERNARFFFKRAKQLGLTVDLCL